MKNAAVLILALLSLSSSLVAGDAKTRPVLSLKVTHDYYIVKDTPGKANYPVTRLEYSISDIANVRAAWIEFLNRPTVVEKKSIAVQKSGELLWDYRDSHVQTDVPSGQLGISIRDPQAWTMGEEEGPVKGYETDPVVIGHTDEYDPARLDSEPALQVMAGSGDVWVTLHGDNLTPLTRFHVSVAEGKSGYCPDQKITARALSMREVRVLIPAHWRIVRQKVPLYTLRDLTVPS